MDDFDEILMPSREELIAQLPDYQKEIITTYLSESDDDPLQVIDMWLNSTPISIAQFGGSGQTDFLQAIKKELHKFLCGDKTYKKEREALLKHGTTAQVFIVSSLTIAIAPVVGVAAPILAPIIVLLISSAGKITIGAWCEVNK